MQKVVRSLGPPSSGQLLLQPCVHIPAGKPQAWVRHCRELSATREQSNSSPQAPPIQAGLTSG